MKLAHTIAAMDRPEDFLLDVAMSGNEEAIELLITALRGLGGEECCFAVLDTIVEADRPQGRHRVTHPAGCVTECVTLGPCTARHSPASCACLCGLRGYAEMCMRRDLMGRTGLEPVTSGLSSRRSPS